MSEQERELVLLALQETYSEDVIVDSQLIVDFITTVTTIDQSTIDDLLPVINQVLNKPNYHHIDPNQMVFKLLERLLTEMSFEQILAYYPPEFICNSLQFKSDPNFSIIMLSLKILNSNINDPVMVSFILENHLLLSLVSNYLYLTSLDIAIVNQIELLINLIVVNEIDDLAKRLFSHDFLNVYSVVRNEENTTLLARLLDYILILFPIFSTSPRLLPSSLYVFTKKDIEKYKDDPLFLILLVEFYIKLTNQLEPGAILKNITPTISELVNGYINQELDDVINAEIINMLVKLSYSKLQDYIKKLIVDSNLFKPYNLMDLHQYDENCIKLLSEFNPDLVVYANPEIYEEVLSNLLLMSNKLLFPILLNFIESPTIFDKLTGPYLNSESLSAITKDRLLQIVFQFSKFTHSKKYLFNDLPNIITTSLLENESINNDIWRLKLETLQNLLIPDPQLKTEVDFWQNDLQAQYNLMKFGKSFKNITPQVDVRDETM
jgi:hypothetical protein